MTNRARTDALLLAGFCAFLFFYGLGQFGLIGADEPRYAQVAREMLERHDWVTPVLNGRPWLEKPPLYYWQAMVAYKVFGVSDWAARLPSGMDAALLVVVLYLFFRRFQPGYEVDGALISASCAGMVGYARAASTDMSLAASFAIGMLGWWAWRENHKKIFLAVFYFFAALGMLAKGPVAPLLSILVIVLYASALREFRLLAATLWLPGIALFCAVALPWYLAVQVRNPGFFREFIIEHNVGRFSQNLYHHNEPFWFYLPVTAVALSPWTVLAIAALVRPVRQWFVKFKPEAHLADRLSLFAACWLLAPAIFFSFSQSKLPGYILPAIPAAGILLVGFLRRRLEERDPYPNEKTLIVLHSLLASALIFPSLLIAYLVEQHRLPSGRPLLAALGTAVAFVAGFVMTLTRKSGLRMLRFITLIPVVLTVGATVKLGSAAIDQTLSARPVAREIAAIQATLLPLAVYHVRRELEYGLTFYRNRVTFNYDWGSVPPEEHLLVAAEDSQVAVAKSLPGRRLSYLGHNQAQHVDYFWVGASRSASTP